MSAQGALPLGYGQLAVAASLVLVAGAVSLALRLKLERTLAIASVRTVVQLALVGHLLGFVFGLDSPWVLVVMLLVMIAAASRAAVARVSRRYRGVEIDAFATLLLTALTTTFTVTTLVVQVRPWHNAQYVVPLLGMVLGNSLTGISLALDALLTDLDATRDAVELDLALGATRWEAARDPLRSAVRRGMIPILNNMSVVGIVSLPGMMTGQILQGADPVAAVKYQVVVMFMLAASTAIGCMGVALLSVWRLFDDCHRLRSDRLERRTEH